MAATRQAATKGLGQLFHDTSKYIYFAERTILSTLPKMAEATQSSEMRAFEQHHGETQEHVARLEKIFEVLDKKPLGKSCAAIMGITQEGAEIIEQYKGSPALDAGLLAAAQAVEHYEISRYGSTPTWAAELGLSEAVRLLDLTLAEEKRQTSRSASWQGPPSISLQKPLKDDNRPWMRTDGFSTRLIHGAPKQNPTGV